MALAVLLFAAMLVLSTGLIAVADPAQQDVPTLVPPTLVPTQPPTNLDALPSESGVARIARDGKVRVGVLYNEPPFGEYNIRGEESGFDADIARAMAEAWGVQVEFDQVTRQTGIDMVTSGSIDLLIAAQPHLRDLDSRVEFSQSYYPAVEALVVRQGDGATVLAHMADRKIGVVLGTTGEMAVDYWLSHVDYQFEVLRYLTLDQALTALNSAGDRRRGQQSNAGQRGDLAGRTADRRRAGDARTLRDSDAAAGRKSAQSGQQDAAISVRQRQAERSVPENFDGASYPAQGFAVWQNVGDAPKLDQFGSDVPFPAQYVVPRMQSEGKLRVAGLVDLPADAPESQRRARRR